MKTMTQVVESELKSMQVGDSIRVNDPDTLLVEVSRVPNGFIYMFRFQGIIHTQFVPIDTKDIPDLREYLK